MSLARVKLVEKRTNKTKKQKCMQMVFEKHNRDNDEFDKKGRERCLNQENRPNGVV